MWRNTTVAAGASTDNGKSEEASGPGKPAEGLVALATELTKTPKAVEPDESIARAVATGWHAREALSAARKATDAAMDAEHPGHAVTAMGHAIQSLGHAFRKHPIAEDGSTPPIVQDSRLANFLLPLNDPQADASDNPRADASDDTNADHGDFLRRVSDLDATDRLSLACFQLTADLAALEPRLKSAGQDPALVAVAIKELGVKTKKPDREIAARNLGSRFVQELLAADYRLGKAYSLGWDMASLADLPDKQERETFRERLYANHVPIRQRLNALASLLPPNVAHAVRRSLDVWTEAVGGIVPPEGGASPARPKQPQRQDLPDSVTADIIKDQIQTWRALLTGEKAAKDMLHADNLVTASAATMEGLAHALAQGLRKAKLAVLGIAVIVLLIAGVLLIALAGTGGEVAGAAALLGSAGLTWKGLGSTVGRGLAKLEQPIWDAEVDEVIGKVITRLPEPNGAEASHAKRAQARR